MPTNKNFGITFGAIFFLIAVYCFINNLYFYPFIFLTIFFLFFGLLNSKILLPFNWIWFKFGILLSKVLSPVILTIFFYFIISPYGLLMRIFNKDIKNIKKRKKKLKVQSFWINSNENCNFNKQF